MIAAVLLVAYAVVAGVVGPRLLRRDWSTCSPQTAIVGWQALTTSVVLALMLAAVALAMPFLPLRHWLASVVGAHAVTLVAHYETPMGGWAGVVGLALVAACAAMLLVTTVRSLARTRRVRRSQLASLRLVARPHVDGFVVVDHDLPVVYCLPGGRGTIVLSSAALAILTEAERGLVLRHERRHLGARHDLALACSAALATTFPRVPLFAEAHRRIAVLLEMSADDAATSSDDRRALARALVVLGTGFRPEATLAAADTAALQRVRRLTAAPRAPRRGLGTAVGTAVVLALAVPVVLALAPAVEAAARECCAVPALAQSRVDQ